MRAITSPKADAATDMRWTALDLVCAVRTVLGLRDRDIATLRGLLSLIGPEGWTGPMMVHASNRVLQERCDGADERSLRRRLVKLVDCGLIARRQSPNRKRYVLRDSDGTALVHYGFDLTPLRDALPQLQQMATEQAAEAERIRVLRGLLRHRLYQISVLGLPTEAAEDVLEEARLALRRNLSAAALEAHLSALGPIADLPETKQMTDSDSQNDRHIESTRQESLQEELPVEAEAADRPIKISLGNCLARIKDVVPFMRDRPESWNGLQRNAWSIGQALGLSPSQITQTEEKLGKNGAALCITGLAQAGAQIRNPRAYLNRVLADARRPDFDILRMFRALTRKKTCADTVLLA